MPDAQEVAAVQQANLAFYRAFESLDPGQMASVWCQDEAVTCIHPGWRLLQGWEDVMQSWERIFDNTPVMHFAITGALITVEGDWAWATCTEHITSVVDGRVSEARVQATNIYRRRASRWLLTHHHGSPSM